MLPDNFEMTVWDDPLDTLNIRYYKFIFDDKELAIAINPEVYTEDQEELDILERCILTAFEQNYQENDLDPESIIRNALDIFTDKMVRRRSRGG